MIRSMLSLWVCSDSAEISPALSCGNTERFLNRLLLKNSLIFSLSPVHNDGSYGSLILCKRGMLLMKSKLCRLAKVTSLNQNTPGPRQTLLNTLRLLLDLILLPALQQNIITINPSGSKRWMSNTVVENYMRLDFIPLCVSQPINHLW